MSTGKEGGRVPDAVWTLYNDPEEGRGNSLRKYWWQLLPHGIPKPTMRNIDRLENSMSAFKTFLILMLVVYELTTILQRLRELCHSPYADSTLALTP